MSRAAQFARPGQKHTRTTDTRCQIGRRHGGLVAAEVLLIDRAAEHVAAWGWSVRLAALAGVVERGDPSAKTAGAIAHQRIEGRGHDALRAERTLPTDVDGRRIWMVLWAVLRGYWGGRHQLWNGTTHLDVITTDDGVLITDPSDPSTPLILVGSTSMTGEVWVPPPLLPTPLPYLVASRAVLRAHHDVPATIELEKLSLASLLEAIAGTHRLVIRTDHPAIIDAARMLGHEVVNP